MASTGVDSEDGSEIQAQTIQMAEIDAGASKGHPTQNYNPFLVAGTEIEEHTIEIEDIDEGASSSQRSIVSSVVSAATSPENPVLQMQMTEIESASASSQGPQSQNNANSDTFNWPILDLLPSQCKNRDLYLHWCVPLHKAALKGDFVQAVQLFNQNPSMVRTAITERYETALHIATGARQNNFVMGMIEMMEEEDLKLQDRIGNTAFSIAAATGSIEIVEAMIWKADLLFLRGSRAMTPLHMAVLLGNKEMAWYLIDHGAMILNSDDRAAIFFQSIKSDLYDIALTMLDYESDYEWNLAVIRGEDGETALHVLARKPPSVFIPEAKSTGIQELMSTTALQLRKRIWKNPIQMESTGNLELNSTAALELLKRIWEKAIQHRDVNIEELIRNPSNLLFTAAKLGNSPFLAELICSYPTLVYEVDENLRTIFHIAILHRHTSIFNLIYEIGFDKELLATLLDEEKNTMLHLAAKYPADQPPVSGLPSAALEMQQELLIFKEVEKLMLPSLREMKNEDDLTPQELFAKEHKVLLQGAELWMRNTATAAMVVTTLIVTVVFSAAFTVPGGFDDKTGMPVLLKHSLFLMFAISDAVALSFSSFSILMFLSILTSGYTQTDFHRSLTLKLMIGLSTLFISIIFMMAAFSSTFFLIYRDKLSSIPTLTLLFASLPIILFVLLQYPLMKNIFQLTRRSMFLSKVAK